MLSSKAFDSPVGRLTLVAGEAGLVAILWENDEPSRVPLGPADAGASHEALDEAERQLCEYFAGRRMAFDLPLDFRGTAFQRAVWGELLKIPYGETRSYGEIARAIGAPTAVRAVGAANGRNPLSIVAPCHRVVGASGKLTGFAGGLEAKAFLLDLERGDARPDLFAAAHKKTRRSSGERRASRGSAEGSPKRREIDGVSSRACCRAPTASGDGSSCSIPGS